MNLFAALDLLGFAAFLLSAAVAYRNYTETRDISNTWLTFTAALTLGSLWSLAAFLEWMGILPTVTDTLQDALFPLMAAALALYSLQAHTSIVKPVR